MTALDLPPDIADLASEAGLGQPLKLFTAHRNMRLFTEDVYVFEHGGVFSKGRGETKVIGWEEVARFYQAVTRWRGQMVDQVTHRYRFILVGGADYKLRAATTLGMKSGLETFGPLVDDLVSRAVLPRLLRAVRGGGSVTFGAYHVSADGISDRKEKTQFAWSEVGGVRCLRSSTPRIQVVSRPQGRADGAKVLLSADTEAVCNRSALFSLVKQFAGAAAADPVDEPSAVASTAEGARVARAGLAQAHGWKFLTHDSKLSYRKMVLTYGLPVPDLVYGRTVGHVRGKVFILFDFPASDGTERTFWAVVLPDKLPLVRITATTAPAGGGGTVPTGDPAFDAAYRVTCANQAEAPRLLTPAVRQRILAVRPASLVIAGTALTQATACPEAGDIPRRLDDLASIAELLPGAVQPA